MSLAVPTLAHEPAAVPAPPGAAGLPAAAGARL